MMKRLVSPKRAAGFSLVELMIAVVIIGLLAALTAPTISRSMERSRYNDLNRAIAGGLQEARAFAMNSGQAIFVRVDEGSGEVLFYTPTNFGVGDGDAMSCSMATGGSGVAASNEDNVILRIAALEFGLENMVLSGSPGNDFCISPKGTFLSETGQILSSGCDGGLNQLIWIYPSSGTAYEDACPTFDQDAKDQRQIDNASVIHVGYSGHVRVMR